MFEKQSFHTVPILKPRDHDVAPAGSLVVVAEIVIVATSCEEISFALLSQFRQLF